MDTAAKSLPLPVRKNLRDTEKDLARQVQRIKAATGQDYVLEADHADIHEKVTDRSDLDQMGTVLYGDDGYFGRVAAQIENLCKDDLSKEAFLEKTPSRKIILKYDNSVWSDSMMAIENGALVVKFDRFNLWMANVSNFKLESIL